MTRTLSWKLVIDSADPHAQAGFWAEALGYLIEDNSALVEQLLAAGAIPGPITTHAHGRLAWRDLAAARHPDDPYDETSGTGLGRRLLFQRVPEPKTVKNRLHIDVHTAVPAVLTRPACPVRPARERAHRGRHQQLMA
ncbi:VOC family protein, partial [Streptomyces cyaneofuscatus]